MCRDKFLREIYLHKIYKRESKAIQTTENLHAKPAEGKNQDVKREISLNQRDYKEFPALYYHSIL